MNGARPVARMTIEQVPVGLMPSGATRPARSPAVSSTTVAARRPSTAHGADVLDQPDDAGLRGVEPT